MDDIEAQIRKIVAEHPAQFTRIILSKKNKHLKDWLDAKFPLLADPIYRVPTKIVWLMNGYTDFPKCKACGSKLDKRNVIYPRGYNDFCSCHCSNGSAEKVAESKKTRFRKNRGQYFSERSKITAKMSFIKHYGVDHNMKSEEGRKAHADALEKKYGKGIRNAFQIKSVKSDKKPQ